EPDMGSDTSLVRKIDEGGFVITDDVCDSPSNLLDGHCLDPVGVVRRHGLVEEARLIDSVRVALHGQWPASQVRQHPGSNATVVIDQIALGYSVCGEQHFRWTRNFYVVAANPNNLSANSQATAPARPPPVPYQSGAPGTVDVEACLQESTRQSRFGPQVSA